VAARKRGGAPPTCLAETWSQAVGERTKLFATHAQDNTYSAGLTFFSAVGGRERRHWKSVTRRQKFAFEHPCFTEEDCARNEYRWVRLPWSAILTLDLVFDDPPLFEGLPLWHCSLALISTNGMAVPVRLWDEDGRKKCERFIRDELLVDVGDPTREATEIGKFALHVRRRCSDREIEELKARRVWPRPQDRARWN
jgi:hypothetical protein